MVRCVRGPRPPGCSVVVPDVQPPRGLIGRFVRPPSVVRPPCVPAPGPSRFGPRSALPHSLVSGLSLAPRNGLRENVPPGPFGPRTVSPQPVSSTRRRLSTDEMQLREVGKLAVHLWKMQWLQKPGPRAPLGAVRPQRSDLPVGMPSGVLRGRVSAARTVRRLSPGTPRETPHSGGGIPAGPRPVSADHPGGSAVAHVELLLCRGI